MNNLVEIKKERIYCKSNMVAEIFEKRHDNVMRDLKSLIENCSKEFSLLHLRLKEESIRVII